jgi:hypothetical protein
MGEGSASFTRLSRSFVRTIYLNSIDQELTSFLVARRVKVFLLLGGAMLEIRAIGFGEIFWGL